MDLGGDLVGVEGRRKGDVLRCQLVTLDRRVLAVTIGGEPVAHPAVTAEPEVDRPRPCVDVELAGQFEGDAQPTAVGVALAGLTLGEGEVCRLHH